VFARDLALALGRRGHKSAIAYYATMEELNLSDVFETDYIAKLDAAGVSHHHLGCRGLRNPAMAAWKLRQIIRSFRPDVIHAHISTSILAKALSGSRAPLVYTHHSTVINFPTSFFKIFDRFVSRYIAICKVAEAMLVDLTTRPVHLIRNGIGWRARQSATNQDEYKTVLSVGSLRPAKNYDALIEVARLLGESTQAVRFLIAGDGPERQKLENKIASFGLEHVVILLGTRKDVDVLMSQASMLLMTSKYEGMPITLIEALYAGLPIISTNVGGCSEAVHHGVNGYLVEPGNVQGLADAVQHLLMHPELALQMAAESRRRAQLFSIEQCALDHEATYLQLLNGAG
jgi:glycosyltransferase involved in cell wall biosynthesis